jgi:hypothetical protein
VGPERQKDGIGGTVAPDRRRLFQSRTTAGRKKCDAELNGVERVAKRADATMIAAGFYARCDNYFSLFLHVSSGFHFESAKPQILSTRGRVGCSQ